MEVAPFTSIETEFLRWIDPASLELQVHDGTEGLHRPAVIHRDLKPKKVLLDDGWKIYRIRIVSKVFIIRDQEISWTPLPAVSGMCLDGWSSEGFKFTVTPSAEGGLDINIGSDMIHVGKHLSALDPLVQMVLFAACDPSMSVFREDECAFRCRKSMVPKGILDMAEEARPSCRAKHIPVVSTKRGTRRAGEEGFVQDSGGFTSVMTDADTHENPHRVARNIASTKKISKLSRTGNGGSGSSGPEDTDMQQQQQQEQHQQQQGGNFATGINSLPSEFAPASAYFGLAAADCLNEKRFRKNPCLRQQCGNGVSAINSTEQQGEPDHYSVFSSRVTAEDGISIAPKNASSSTATTWLVASAAPHHATGDRALLSDFTAEHGDIFLQGGDAGAMPMQVLGRGVLATGAAVLPDVWYVPGLAANLVSVSQLAELGYSVAFGRGKCYIRSGADGKVVGAARTAHRGGRPVCS